MDKAITIRVKRGTLTDDAGSQRRPVSACPGKYPVISRAADVPPGTGRDFLRQDVVQGFVQKLDHVYVDLEIHERGRRGAGVIDTIFRDYYLDRPETAFVGRSCRGSQCFDRPPGAGNGT